MGPKATRKLKKAEKVHNIRAKASYSTTQHALQPGSDAFCQQLMVAEYIPGKVKAMNLAELQALEEAMNETTRNDQLFSVVLPRLVPPIAPLEADKGRIENTLKALRDCFEVGFTEAFYADVGFKTEPLFELVADEIQARVVANDQAAQQAAIDAEVARRLAAMNVNNAPAPMEDI